MNRKLFVPLTILALLALWMSSSGGAIAQTAGPQGAVGTVASTLLSTSFTYQGQLKKGNTPVTGDCSMAFRLYDAASGGNPFGSTITPTVTISNSLFTVPLDFGASAFAGEARWLGIQVKCPGDTDYADLSRQPITAAPYSLYSTSTGALQGRAVADANPATNQVLKWNGSAWVPANDETSGGPGNSWSLAGNAGTNPLTNFLGTTDNVSLTFRVNNIPALRLIPNATSPNIVGGHGGNNVSSGVYGAVINGGGYSSFPNLATANFGTIGGGYGNTVSSLATVGGGYSNSANGIGATVSGGGKNVASGDEAAVSGGRWNTASGSYTTISGGYNNTASGGNVTVSGGYHNTAAGLEATIGGGTEISVTGRAGTIAGGSGNTLTGDYATISGGWHNSASGITATIGGGENISVTGRAATVAGGSWITATGDYAAVGGGANNTASGFASFVGGGGGDLYGIPSPNRASGDWSVIGGGNSNSASGWAATIGGGYDNTASIGISTIGGGAHNTAGSGYATIGGGDSNIASNTYATIGGGKWNIASGTYATVPGGYSNTAGGDYSFAAGQWARTAPGATGSFVWSDSLSAPTVSWNPNEFVARATGGFWFISGIDASGNIASGMRLPGGSSAWSPLSDRNAKTNYSSVNGRDVLARLAAIPIQTWNYKAQDPAIRHIGPVAQDFYAAFKVGEDDKFISTVDADGVALASIQGLYQIVQEKDNEISNLKSQMSKQQAEMDEMKTRLSALEARAGSNSASSVFGGWNLLPLALAGLAVGFVASRRGGGR
jgi:hypothetical protein